MNTIKLLWPMLLLLTPIIGFAQDGIRCNGKLLETGEANITQIEECTNDSESIKSYHVQNNNADITHVYIKKGGMTNDLKFIDGKLISIDSNR